MVQEEAKVYAIKLFGTKEFAVVIVPEVVIEPVEATPPRLTHFVPSHPTIINLEISPPVNAFTLLLAASKDKVRIIGSVPFKSQYS